MNWWPASLKTEKCRVLNECGSFRRDRIHGFAQGPRHFAPGTRGAMAETTCEVYTAVYSSFATGRSSVKAVS